VAQEAQRLHLSPGLVFTVCAWQRLAGEVDPSEKAIEVKDTIVSLMQRSAVRKPPPGYAADLKFLHRSPLASFDSEVRKRECRRMMRTSDRDTSPKNFPLGLWQRQKEEMMQLAVRGQ